MSCFCRRQSLISDSLRKLRPNYLHRSLTANEQHEPLNLTQIFIKYLRAKFPFHDFEGNGTGLLVIRVHSNLLVWKSNLSVGI